MRMVTEKSLENMKISETIYNKLPDDLKTLFIKLPNPSSDEVVELFPNTTTHGVKTPFIGDASKKINIGGGNVKPYKTNSGSAARFFYCAKASKSERNMGCEGLEEKQRRKNMLAEIRGVLFAENSF